MEIDSNTQRVPLDIHKAIRLKNLVKSGNFHIRAQNNNKNNIPKNLVQSELKDLKKDSVQTENLIKKSNNLRDSALKSQHRFIWLKNFNELNHEIESLSIHSNLIPVEMILEGEQHNKDFNRLIENIVLRNHELVEYESDLVNHFLNEGYLRESKEKGLHFIKESLEELKIKEYALMSVNFINESQKPVTPPDSEDLVKDEIYNSNDTSIFEDSSSCSDLTTIPEVSVEEDKSISNLNVESSDSGIDSKNESNSPTQVLKVKDSDGNENQNNFLDKILSDVYNFYERKLNVLKLKLSMHSQIKPGQRELEVYLHLKHLYEGHPNENELWMDMYNRIFQHPYFKTGRNSGYSPPKKVSRWISQNEQLRINYEACLEDLRRESQKISDIVRKTEASRKSKKDNQAKFLLKVKEQKELCTQLKDTLTTLKEARKVTIEKEERMKGLEMKKQCEREFLDMERKKRYLEEQKTKIFEHTAAKRIMILERKSILEKEVDILLQKKKEQGLRNMIRVNFRRVLAQGKNKILKDKEKEKEMDSLEREARLQALRKISRRRTEVVIARIKAQRGMDPEKEFIKAICSRATIASEEKFKKELDPYSLINSPFKTLYTYTSDDILSDSRIVVENIFREKGLIQSNYARQQILSIPPPNKPRPETQSQIKLNTDV